LFKVACRWPGRDSHPQRESYETDTLPLDHLHLQKHMGVNNLPRVAIQQCAGRESNLRPLDHKSNALTTILSSCLMSDKFRHSIKVGSSPYLIYACPMNLITIILYFEPASTSNKRKGPRSKSTICAPPRVVKTGHMHSLPAAKCSFL